MNILKNTNPIIKQESLICGNIKCVTIMIYENLKGMDIMNKIIKTFKSIILAILIVFIVCVTIIGGIIMDVPDVIIKILVIGEFLFSIIINLNGIQ